MRRRIIRTLLAGAAAGVTAATLGFTAAGAATAPSAAPMGTILNPPSGGTPIYTTANCNVKGPIGGRGNAPAASARCAMSGYQASGRDFRFAQAMITVPTTDGDVDTSPEFYVGLGDTNGFARVGILPCGGLDGGPIVGPSDGGPDPCPDGWEGFYEVFQDGSPILDAFVPFSGVSAGDGVFFSIYFNAVGNAVRLAVTLPDGTTTGQTVAVNGSVYTTAMAVADWSDVGGPAAPPANTRVTQFFQGRFTTLSGQTGTFKGPWTLKPVEITTNGLAPPSGTLLSAPSYLWTDGNSFKGMPGDAFGAWLYNP